MGSNSSTRRMSKTCWRCCAGPRTRATASPASACCTFPRHRARRGRQGARWPRRRSRCSNWSTPCPASRQRNLAGHGRGDAVGRLIQAVKQWHHVIVMSDSGARPTARRRQREHAARAATASCAIANRPPLRRGSKKKDVTLPEKIRRGARPPAQVVALPRRITTSSR